MANNQDESVIDELTQRLTDRAEEKTKRHWQSYLKGNAEFLGVPMAGVRATVKELWCSELDRASPERQRAVFAAWSHQPYTEQKLAAVLLAAEFMDESLTVEDLPLLATPLASGSFADWNIVDWYAMKALARYVAAEPRATRSRAVIAWAYSPEMWQRRASVVAFVPHAKTARAFLSDLPELLLPACEENISWSTNRFAHTGTGWLLWDLSACEPELVQVFVQEHPELSPEAQRMALAKLRPGKYRRR
jgi:3-methyladenine DNA glycosylase AlkD